MTSIIYATSYRTQSGSTIYQTVTTSAAPSSSPDQDNTGKKHKKNVNVGAIVGGVVGGVGGAAVASVILLFLIRHFNKRREQERMEQEYQEAIKPVDFGGDKSHVANSSILSLNRGPSSGSFDEEARSGHATNPFDDSRRISNGSILREESPSNPKVLTVVNPDEHDWVLKKKLKRMKKRKDRQLYVILAVWRSRSGSLGESVWIFLVV